MRSYQGQNSRAPAMRHIEGHLDRISLLRLRDGGNTVNIFAGPDDVVLISMRTPTKSKIVRRIKQTEKNTIVMAIKGYVHVLTRTLSSI